MRCHERRLKSCAPKRTVFIPTRRDPKKSPRRSDISIWNASGFVEAREQLLPPPHPQGCCKSISKQEHKIRAWGHKQHRNRSKLGSRMKEKNQLCQNPLLTISAGEGAFFCFCCSWLFWEWRPGQPRLFVCLLSLALIVDAQRGGSRRAWGKLME